jgi:hypothetical protein
MGISFGLMSSSDRMIQMNWHYSPSSEVAEWSVHASINIDACELNSVQTRDRNFVEPTIKNAALLLR